MLSFCSFFSWKHLYYLCLYLYSSWTNPLNKRLKKLTRKMRSINSPKWTKGINKINCAKNERKNSKYTLLFCNKAKRWKIKKKFICSKKVENNILFYFFVFILKICFAISYAFFGFVFFLSLLFCCLNCYFYKAVFGVCYRFLLYFFVCFLHTKVFPFVLRPFTIKEHIFSHILLLPKVVFKGLKLLSFI